MSDDRELPKPGGCLGLDVAQVSGFAYAFPGEEPIWGHRRMGPERADMGEVLAFFGVWLGSTLDKLRPRHVAVESPYIPQSRPLSVQANGASLPFQFAPQRKGAPGPPPINMATVWRLCAMTGLVFKECFERGIDCEDVPGQVWAKFFIGRGGAFGGRIAKKKAAIEAARIYGWQATDDESDALGVLLWLEHKHYPQIAQLRRPIGTLRLPTPARRNAAG